MAYNRDLVISTLRDIAAKYPRAYANAHRDENQHPEAWDFNILGARALYRFDPKYGMNGKRANRNTPSSDVIAYRENLAGQPTDRGCRVFDIIIGAGEHGTNLDRITSNEVTLDSRDPVTGEILTLWLDPNLLRTAVDYAIPPELPPTKPDPPKPEPPVIAKPKPYPDEQTWWPSYVSNVVELYRKAYDAGKRNTPDLDPMAFIWFSRMGHSSAYDDLERARQKHLDELASALGLK